MNVTWSSLSHALSTSKFVNSHALSPTCPSTCEYSVAPTVLPCPFPRTYLAGGGASHGERCRSPPVDPGAPAPPARRDRTAARNRLRPRVTSSSSSSSSSWQVPPQVQRPAHRATTRSWPALTRPSRAAIPATARLPARRWSDSAAGRDRRPGPPRPPTGSRSARTARDAHERVCARSLSAVRSSTTPADTLTSVHPVAPRARAFRGRERGCRGCLTRQLSLCAARVRPGWPVRE